MLAVFSSPRGAQKCPDRPWLMKSRLNAFFTPAADTVTPRRACPGCECDDAARRRGRRSEARADTFLERMYSRRGDRLPRHRWPMDDLVSLPKRRNRSQMHTGVMCLPGVQRDAVWATAPEIGCFLHRLRSRWGIRFTKAGETSELLADPVAPLQPNFKE